MTDLTNQFIGGYHFQWQIARGGMATVYLGQRADDPAAPPVAIKVLHPHFAANPNIRKRFQREAEIGQRLRHRNIVRVFELVEADDQLFMVMQYLPGGSLAERIEKQGALKWLEALTVLKQVGRALSFAHSQGVIHRDVKPSNILFDDYGDAYLSDFGVAHEMDASTLTSSGFQPGTAAYMSPEQIQGKEVDESSDLFSLAVVCYRTLTGSLPFEGTTTAALTYQIVHKPPKRLPRRSDIPKGAQKALARALDKNPAERYQSIPAFINALEEATVGGSAGRPIWAWAAGAMLILALAVTAGLVFARTKPPPKESSATRAVVQNLATVTPTEQNEAPATSAPTALPQTSTPTALPSPGIHLNDMKDNETPMAYETMSPSTGEPAAGTVASNDGDPIPTLIVATSTPPPTPTRIKPKKRTPPTPPPLGTDDGDGLASRSPHANLNPGRS